MDRAVLAAANNGTPTPVLILFGIGLIAASVGIFVLLRRFTDTPQEGVLNRPLGFALCMFLAGVFMTVVGIGRALGIISHA